MKTFLTFLCALVVLPALVFATERYPSISEAELKQAMAQKKVTLLDANGTDSWKAGHIPGAIDFESARENLAALLPGDKSALIVAYCADPDCGAYNAAAKAAKDLGYTNIRHFSPGIEGWKASGEPMEKG